MKNYLIILTSFIFISNGFTQVGIDTETPSAKLDINGDLKVRDVDLMNTFSDPTILVHDEASDHLIKGIKYSKLFSTTESLVYAYQKNTPALIKLNLNTSITIGGIQWNIFSLEDGGSGGYLPIGSSDVFNGNTYTAPSTGYYMVNLELQFTGLVNASVLLGARNIAVIKNNSSIVYSKPYDGITLDLLVLSGNIPLSSTTMETIVQLNKDDTLRFGIQNTLLNASVLGGSTFKLMIFKLPN